MKKNKFLIFKILLSKKIVVVAVVNVGLWVKKRWQKRWLYPQLHIFVLLSTKFQSKKRTKKTFYKRQNFNRSYSERWRIFSFERAGSVGKKVFFCGWKDSEMVLAKMVLLWSFFQKTEQRKAFYIIKIIRNCQRKPLPSTPLKLRYWQTSTIFAYNFDYVICCGIKALEKRSAKLWGKCLFLIWGRDI